MKCYITKTKECQELERVHCNKCAIRCDSNVEKDWASIEIKWGYFSNKDLRKDSWDLCEKCYDEFIKTFKIPIDTEEEL